MFKKALEAEQSLSAVMCDIDHFKKVNDVYGHDVGDEVLREVSKRIKKAVRTFDLACRFGGEEFVVIMPETDADLAGRVAERIRLEVETHPVIAAKGARQVHVTMSFGVSSLEYGNDAPEKLMKRADVALYTAKRNGRNRVVTEFAA